jgi:hypothetical protein
MRSQWFPMMGKGESVSAFGTGAEIYQRIAYWDVRKALERFMAAAMELHKDAAARGSRHCRRTGDDSMISPNEGRPELEARVRSSAAWASFV